MTLLLGIAACFLSTNMLVSATGSFELEVLGIQNTRGELSNGSCCTLPDIRLDNGTCVGQCRTFFRLCLKEYQTEVSDTGPCTFGNVSTSVVGGNSFSMHANPHHHVVLKLPFTFRWTVSTFDAQIDPFLLFLCLCTKQTFAYHFGVFIIKS
ncbi:protein jagged-1a [Trichonephila clavata]|uniref:Protein jagged-1a n=1 Tax=Trichonephila clavata TaxID=2740835 RepID=A0A8X6I739_TRICU|nr:protein jagged-1a [Trichonephila clavata]